MKIGSNKVLLTFCCLQIILGRKSHFEDDLERVFIDKIENLIITILCISLAIYVFVKCQYYHQNQLLKNKLPPANEKLLEGIFAKEAELKTK